MLSFSQTGVTLNFDPLRPSLNEEELIMAKMDKLIQKKGRYSQALSNAPSSSYDIKISASSGEGSVRSCLRWHIPTFLSWIEWSN
jgi:hypothetical protein